MFQLLIINTLYQKANVYDIISNYNTKEVGVLKLLVVGSGGREHAIAKKLLASKGVDQVLWHLVMMV